MESTSARKSPATRLRVELVLLIADHLRRQLRV